MSWHEGPTLETAHVFETLIGGEIFYQLIRNSFQNYEEWRLFHYDSTFGCWVMQDFELRKLEDLWHHNVELNCRTETL